MLDYLKKFEMIVIAVLVVFMVVVLILATADLGLDIIKSIQSPPLFLIDTNELLEIFGFFLLVLIGIELLESVKAYLSKKELHVEVVFTVALVAVARKVIILDIKELPSFTLLGIAAIIIALSIGYYLLKESHRRSRPDIKKGE